MQKKISFGSLKNRFATKPYVFSLALTITVIVLISSLITLSIKNIHRERNFMEQALLSEALAIAHAIEAACNCSLIQRTSNPAHIEAMLVELGRQPGVLYISIVKPDGTTVADSNPKRIGLKTAFSPPTPRSKWHGLKTRMGFRAYEVVLRYLPTLPQNLRNGNSQFFLLVGMDPRPYKEALLQDLKLTGIILAITLVAAISGIAIAFWSSLYYRTERSLKNMEALTTLIVTQMPVGMIITDYDGNIVSLNNAAKKLLQLKKGENINKLKRLDLFFEELKITGTIAERELNIDLPTQKRNMIVSAFKINTEYENIAYMILFTDATRIKELESQLNRSRKLAALGQLAAGLAHEVRNPLSSIKGFAKIIANRTDKNKKTQHILTAFSQEINRLDRVITELLEFAKPTVLNRKNVSCISLINESLKMLEKQLKEKKIKVYVNVNPPNLEVYADGNKIVQALLNIFLNAIEAMEIGGILKVTAKKNGKEIVFCISDTGHGIAPEHLDRLFDPYFTTKPHGVGLGLANVHKIVEAHNGTIEVVGESGKGSTFTIKIPKIW